jgi:hypothetical protein
VTQRAHVHHARFLVLACALAFLLAVSIVTASGPGEARSDVTAQATGEDPAEPRVPVAGQVPAPATLAAPEVAAPSPGLASAATSAAEARAAPSTDLAVAVLDRATGELSLGRQATEPYYTASLAKVLVAVDILDRRRLEALVVSEADIDLIRRALGPSDDEAMNVLWVRFDGPGAAGRVSGRLGLTGTTAPRDPSQWGDMSVTATDIVRIWQYILDEIPAADRDLLISAMAAAPAIAADGFDQAFGLLAPSVDGPGAPGAVAKQGWMCCHSDDYHLHSAGAVGPDQRFLVALLTRMPSGPGWTTARQELTAIATAAVQALR